MKAAARLAGVALALAAAPAWTQQTVGPFRDVPETHWAYQAIERLHQKGILVGYPDHARAKPRSGIEGAAEVGPVRPVERPGQKNTRPLAAAIITLQPAEGGREIARTKTNASGRFRLTAAPGKYRLVPLPPNPRSRYPIGQPQEVMVRAGEITHVTLRHDSGIR